MQIAVTGGSGRIGRTVIALALEQGHSVISIDRTSPATDTVSDAFAFIKADLTDYQAFEESLHGCQALIHLAAIPSPRGTPDHLVHNNNVVTSYNALSAANQLGMKRICMASSINATGVAYSRWPHFDYLPLDEEHPTYDEDPYSLSKWIGEQQANSFARRHEDLHIASLRLHGIATDREMVDQLRTQPSEKRVKQLWGYTLMDAVGRACLLALSADFSGHEIFYIVAPETAIDVPSLELKDRYFPDVPVRGDLSGYRGFFDCQKAERLLGWKHNGE